MIDTRALAQEVQDQLIAAMHRSQEQLRRSQEQLRRSQEQLRRSQEQLRKGQDQVRKGREAMLDAIRTGNQFAKSVRSNFAAQGTLPSAAKLRADAQELAGQLVATQRSLADKALQAAGPLAEHVAATRRNLADRAVQAASPVVVDGVAKLTQVVSAWPGVRKYGHAATNTAHRAVIAEEAPAAAEHVLHSVVAEDAATDRPVDVKPAAVKASKPRAPKASPARASTAKASTAKARTTKAATGKTSTAMAASPRTRAPKK